MKYDLKEYNRDVPDSELISDVISVSKKIGKDKVTLEEYSKFGKYHPSTLQRRFKSWFKVLENAGLTRTRSPFDISKQELYENLASVWIKLGRQPGHRDMKAPLSKYGGNTYIRHFGTWMNSLKSFIEYENASSTDDTVLMKQDRPIEITETKAERPEKDTRTISLRLRFSVFLRDGFRCTSCGKSPLTHPGIELHCDHILPWSKGGKTIMTNLKTLCSQCNLGKGNLEEAESIA
jgi:hypothetical protein